MAVIFNNSDPGSHIGTLCLIYRVLRRSEGKEITISQLKDLCTPETLARNNNQTKKFNATLDFWAGEYHKLWRVDENNTLFLLHVTESINPAPEEIAKVVRDALFGEKIEIISNNMRDNLHSIEPMFLFLSCLLSVTSHGPFDENILDSESISKTLTAWLGSLNSLNNSELPNVIPWLLFLGFLNISGEDVVIDPTKVVKDELVHIFTHSNEIPIRMFVEALADRVPVFDGGHYQQQTVKVMRQNNWQYDFEKNISSSLSLALHRLEAANIISLQTGADDINAIELPRPLDQKSRMVSTIRYRGVDSHAK